MMEVMEQVQEKKSETEELAEPEPESILGLDMDLELNCELEELSPVQLAAQERLLSYNDDEENNNRPRKAKVGIQEIAKLALALLLAIKNHTRVMDMMQNWRIDKRKIASHTSNGLQMLSAKPIVPKPPVVIRQPPQQPVVVSRPALKPTTTAPAPANSTIRFISQNGQVISNVRPIMTKAGSGPATTTQGTIILPAGTYSTNSQFPGVVRQNRPIQITTMGQQVIRPQTITTQAPFAIRQNGPNAGNTNGIPVQQLIFDASSGLLLMPQQQQQHQPNIMSTPVRIPNINVPARPVSVSSFRQGVPISTTTPVRRTGPVMANPTPYNPPVTSVVSAVKTYQTPKIVSSTSLNPGIRQPTTSAQVRQPVPAAGRTVGQGRTVTSISGGRPASNGGTAAATAVANAGNSSAGAATGSAGSETDANNRTFPSLVVNVKPCLHEKPSKGKLNEARSELDARVKALLIYQSAKFTEWLMQKGMLKLEHRCTVHQNGDKQPIPYKLGMYSDGNKQPFSGGYVWISECCADKQITVFQGSIFEASIYPPGTLMKLIYHWSCQTSAANVLLWVKVTSYYLKNFYTLLRSACVAALHEFAPIMGGKAKFVEVGIITLGTTLAVQSGQKQVKVEILGVFDPSTKVVRMKVINPQNVGVTSASHSRVMQILWPLNHWVDKSSIILIDTSIEKSLLIEMGFKNVHQCKTNTPTASSKTSTPTNINVMNYLKHVVPKMFQNTLCVLSKSLIQQFLDELSWRELWGETAATTFDKMIEHLIQMTKWETGESLISRLNRISLNPFGEWSYSRGRTRTGIEMLPESIRGGNNDMPELSLQVPLTGTGKMNGTSASTAIAGRARAGNSSGAPPRLTPVSNKPPVLTPQVQYPGPSSAGGVKRKLETQSTIDLDLNRHYMSEPKTICLQNYYYAECSGKPLSIIPNEFPTTLKCPLCSKAFMSNQEVIRHIFIHVQSMGVRPSSLHSFCEFCLKDVGPVNSLQSHINEVHKMIGVSFPCLICQEKFHSQTYLTLHMWENHGQHEMPYRCETCDYKTSFHYDVVTHFAKEHSGVDSVLCPLCLKVLTAKTFTCMKQIVVHLQSHTIRKGKKCGQCTLTFNGDIEYRAHLAENSHQSEDLPSPERQVIPYEVVDGPAAEIKMAKPPKVKRITIPAPIPPLKKIARIDTSSGSGAGGAKRLSATARAQLQGDGTQYQYNELTMQFSNPKAGNSKCLECLKLTGNEDHFPGYMVCIKCRFATCCRTAMTTHTATVHPNIGDINLSSSFKVEKSELLPSKIFCGCGFGTRSGNKMVRHLVSCNKTTALSELPPECDSDDAEEEEDTKDLAAKLTAPPMPNLLGQLGLTRKFD